MKLFKESEKPFQGLYEMNDGDICVIKIHRNSPSGEGKLAQRYSDSLIVLGEGKGSSYPTIFTAPISDDIRVEILPKGTLLEI